MFALPPRANQTEIQEMLAKTRELTGKRRYEHAHETMGIEITTPWEDLTPEQKQKVYDEMDRYNREMQALGDAIARGDVPTGLRTTNV